MPNVVADVTAVVLLATVFVAIVVAVAVAIVVVFVATARRGEPPAAGQD